jgi:hypothetical protein
MDRAIEESRSPLRDHFFRRWRCGCSENKREKVQHWSNGRLRNRPAQAPNNPVAETTKGVRSTNPQLQALSRFEVEI